MLYRRGKHSNTCTLILSGKIGIYAGKDEFPSELGAWSTLAGDALLLDDAAYLPDFSAFVASDAVRMLHLTRGDYLQALEETGLPQQYGQQYEPMTPRGIDYDLSLLYSKDEQDSESKKASGFIMQQPEIKRKNSHNNMGVGLVGSAPLAHSLVERRYYRKQKQAASAGMAGSNAGTSQQQSNLPHQATNTQSVMTADLVDVLGISDSYDNSYQRLDESTNTTVDKKVRGGKLRQASMLDYVDKKASVHSINLEWT